MSDVNPTSPEIVDGPTDERGRRLSKTASMMKTLPRAQGTSRIAGDERSARAT